MCDWKSWFWQRSFVEEIIKRLSSQLRNFQVVCVSGVSCKSYDGVATTVHSQYGLQTCKLPEKLLVERALERNNIVDNIEEKDTDMG